MSVIDHHSSDELPVHPVERVVEWIVRAAMNLIAIGVLFKLVIIPLAMWLVGL